MFSKLNEVILSDGSRATLAMIQGPDPEWADQIRSLLGHKGPFWKWQNAQCIEQDLGIDSRYHVLISKGKLFANICTFEINGVGLFAHVWTSPEMRKKGAASILTNAVIDDFKARGKAVVLGTEYNSIAYHLYLKHGFVGVEKNSRYMELFSGDREVFEKDFYRRGGLTMRPVCWQDWPTAPFLFLSNFPGVIRSLHMNIIGRGSTEGGLLKLIQHNEQHEEKTSWSLSSPETGAVLAVASYHAHPHWPESIILDVYSHPDCWDQCPELIDRLNLPDSPRILSYSDSENKEKCALLSELGFKKSASFRDRVYKDAEKTSPVDVFEYEK
jgi:GNAT superfamily N-acetyltransferase